MEIVRNDFEIAKAILSEAISGGFSRRNACD
jgi:hypothetical protein